MLYAIQRGQTLSGLDFALIKFGQFDAQPFVLQEFPFFIILAAGAGLLGSLFNQFNGQVNKIRKGYLDTKWKKVLETGFMAALTATFVYNIPHIVNVACIPMQSSGYAESVQYMCPEGMQNPIATLLFNPQSAVIKDFLSIDAKFSPESQLPILLIGFAFMSMTYGTFIPSGLFVPGLLIGCSIGRLTGFSVEALGLI